MKLAGEIEWNEPATAMSIVHVYKDYFPVLGGIENHVRMLAEGQAALGHEVTVLVCRRGLGTRVEEVNGVRVVRTGRIAHVASMPVSLALPRCLRRLEPDVVHLHSPFPLGEVSNLLVGRARATVLTHHSDIVRQRFGLALYAPLLDRVLGSADAVIATSERYARTSPWLSRHRERSVVIPLAIDPGRFRPQSRDEHRANGQPSLLFVGRLRYYKGLDTLLRALGRVPEARLSIVGDGPMKASWIRLASRLGLDDRVFFEGEVPERELPERYAGADLFVLPSNARAEAFGTVLLEAMASGLPSISTELGTGTSWVNRDGVTGRVVPPDDPEVLASAIRELLSDEALRERMGRAARARVCAEFALETMIDRIERAYRAALGRPAIPAPSPLVRVG